MPRLFIAIDLSEPIRSQLVQFQQELQEILGSISWVKPASMHLTLKFLGEIPEEQFPPLETAFRESLQNIPSFEMDVRGTGVFPNWSGPRILWAGVRKGSGELRAMSREIEDQMEKLGFNKEPHIFVPHLTLGRAKGRPGREKDKAEKFFIERKDQLFGKQWVSEVVLMQSTLTPQGAVYKQVISQKLKDKS